MPYDDEPVKTHNTRQKIVLAGFLYILIVVALAFYIAANQLLFAPYIKAQLSYRDGKYPQTLYLYIITGITAVVLYPFLWLIKKRIVKNSQAAYDILSLGTTAQKEFTFTYNETVYTISTYNAFIQIQIGFKTITFATNKLRNFYLFVTSNDTLIFCYEDDKGKLKKCQVQSIKDDAQMASLNAEMEKRFPERSLNRLSDTEAFQEMDQLPPAGAGVAVITIILFIILIVAIILNWPK